MWPVTKYSQGRTGLETSDQKTLVHTRLYQTDKSALTLSRRLPPQNMRTTNFLDAQFASTFFFLHFRPFFTVSLTPIFAFSLLVFSIFFLLTGIRHPQSNLSPLEVPTHIAPHRGA